VRLTYYHFYVALTLKKKEIIIKKVFFHSC